MEKIAYDYYLESENKGQFIVDKTTEWNLPEGDLIKILNLQYKEKRKEEYPPIEDYIDGVVKGDQNQIDKYIQKCIEVKSKYPKPME